MARCRTKAGDGMIVIIPPDAEPMLKNALPSSSLVLSIPRPTVVVCTRR